MCDQNSGTAIEAAIAIATNCKQLVMEGTYKTCFQYFFVHFAVQTDNRTSTKACVEVTERRKAEESMPGGR